jgi:hypothetical protein
VLIKFYKLSKAISSEDVLDEDLDYASKKVHPNVNGATIKDAVARRAFIDKRINRRKICREIPVLDHFYCYNGTDNKEYDWILLDGYYTTGSEVPIRINGFLVSAHFKQLLDNSDLILGSDHHFYPAFLRYQGDLREYYLFQYCYDHNGQVVWEDVRMTRDNELCRFNNDDDFFETYIKLYKARILNEYHTAFVLKNYSDIVILPEFGYTMISEKFRNLIIDNEISGFIVAEVDFISIKFDQS